MVQGEGTGPDVTVSVVIPTVNAGDTIEACLAPLVSRAAEIIVVDASSDQTPQLLRNRSGVSLRFFQRPLGTSLEKLRFVGLQEANSEIVALLEQHAVPSEEWVTTIVDAVRQGAEAGGGAVAQARPARIRDWALYFARYYRFMPPLPKEFFPDFSAVNVFYRRSLLDGYLAQMEGEFAETFFHQLLSVNGVSLHSVPRAVVTSFESAGFLQAVRRRYRSGRSYGMSSAASLDLTARVFRVFRAGLLPAVFWVRCAAVVFRRRNYILAFLACTPILLCYFLAWAVGEAAGFRRGTK